MLQNQYLLARIGADAAEDEPRKEGMCRGQTFHLRRTIRPARVPTRAARPARLGVLGARDHSAGLCDALGLLGVLPARLEAVRRRQVRRVAVGRREAKGALRAASERDAR